MLQVSHEAIAILLDEWLPATLYRLYSLLMFSYVIEPTTIVGDIVCAVCQITDISFTDESICCAAIIDLHCTNSLAPASTEAPQHKERERKRVLHLPSHSGLMQVCQDIPWHIPECILVKLLIVTYKRNIRQNDVLAQSFCT